MFGGENGGHGILTDAEQQGLVDYHDIIPVPINPHLDANSDYSAQAAMGKDLFFGTNDTGRNPTGRHANCAECHPDNEDNPLNFPGPRFYTADFINPIYTSGENLAGFDPDCFVLRESIAGDSIRNVNTGVNIDIDGVGGPDGDRNLDGFSDLETYTPLNADTDDDFKRDDPNSYLCPCPGGPDCDVDFFRIFTRPMTLFSIPTKLGVFATGPYFHDHVAFSLRSLVDPEGQDTDPIYGSLAFPPGKEYPSMLKVFNDVHDVQGHGLLSKVQNTLLSPDAATARADMEAILAYIQSL